MNENPSTGSGQAPRDIPEDIIKKAVEVHIWMLKNDTKDFLGLSIKENNSLDCYKIKSLENRVLALERKEQMKSAYPK